MKRSPLKRTEWKRTTTALPRSKPKSRKKPPPGGFPEQVRMAVRRRSGGICEVGSSVCTGRGEEFHHRKLRRHGDHTQQNCLYACKQCHVYIHHHTGVSYLMGWLVKSFMEPNRVDAMGGDRYLTFHRTQH